MKKVVLLTCVLALIATAALAVGCGGSSTSSSTTTPQAVVQKFLQSTKDKNVNGVWDTITKSNQSQTTKTALSSALASQSSTGLTWKIGKVTTTGNNATVAVTITENGQSQTGNVVLAKEGGVWKVDLAKTAAQP